MLPYLLLTPLTTWGAIVTTYMVAKRLLENWIYWFVIDTISVFLFYSRGLILTSILFFVYLIIIYFGYKSWTQMKDEIESEKLKKNSQSIDGEIKIISPLKIDLISANFSLHF